MAVMTPYPPLARVPLRTGGMFGMAWQLYKRGFFPLFFVSLLVIGLPILLMMLSYFSMISMQSGFAQFGQSSSLSPEIILQQVQAILESMLLMGALLLLVVFLCGPMYMGTAYLEMEERMEGHTGTLGQLFRYALPIGLKRFYTTFLALFVLQIGVNMVTTLIDALGAAGTVFSLFPALSSSPNAIARTPAFFSLGFFLNLALGFCASAFMALIYPIAAHEKKFAFSAVGRAVKLAARHFGRILGLTLLYMLAAFLFSGILCLPALLLWQNVAGMSALLAVLLAFALALVSPYGAAFYTALYVDIAARVDGPEIAVIDPDSVPDPDPDELREGPRTL